MSDRLKWVLGATVAAAVATLVIFVALPGRHPAGSPTGASATEAAVPGSSSAQSGAEAKAGASTPVPAAANGTLALSVTDDGFVPDRAKVTAGQPLTLEITRKTDATCATAIVIPDYGIQKDLPLGQTVAISFTPKKSGELHYGCAHGQMVSGVLVVE